MAANKKKEQPISLRFLFIFTAFIIAFFVYATTPNDIKKIKQTKTFEEMLEYSNDSISNKIIEEEKIETSIIPKQQTYYQSNQTVYTPLQNYVTEKKKRINYKDDADFLELLDNLRKQPSMSTTSAEVIVKEILKYKGFPEYCVNVVIEDENTKQKTQGSYVAAYFNISSGDLHVNKEVLYKTSIEQTVAIIAHELDHFEKNAQICKSMGTDAYAKLLTDNKTLGLNVAFWDNAQKYADISNFDAKQYKDALTRYLSQGSIDLTSSYSDLYRLAEHIRNPMELSAYEVSDFIFDYYGVPNEEGPLKKLVEKFNSLDWTIHNLIAKDSLLKDERIAFFDYFFIQAILSTYPQYKDKYNNCIESGNMTEFWLAFEKDHESFYNKNMQLDEKTYNSIFNLIIKTETIAKQGINNNIVCSALKFKTNTLLANIVFPNAIKFIKEAANDYLSFIKQNNIYSPKDELNTILTLICIENNITTKNQEEISLYYIKLPKEIESLYGIKGKNRRYHFIYKNEAFQNLLKEKKAENTNITDQQLLSDLLNNKKLNDRNKY